MIKRIPIYEIIETPYMLEMIKWRCFHLLGIPWTKRIEWWEDWETNEIVFRYE